MTEVIPNRVGVESEKASNALGRPGISPRKILVLGVLRLDLNVYLTQSENAIPAIQDYQKYSSAQRIDFWYENFLQGCGSAKTTSVLLTYICISNSQ